MRKLCFAEGNSGANSHWPPRAAKQCVFGTDVGRDGLAVPPHCPRSGRRPRHYRDGGERASGPGTSRSARARSWPESCSLRHTAGGLRGALDGRRGAHGGTTGRRHHRYQHGLPGPRGDGQAGRLGADARPRPCHAPGRGRGRRGGRARHAEDAHRLGWGEPQRAGPGAARRGRRRGADHGACAHALRVLQGTCRLGLRAPREGGRARARRHQRRHRRSCDRRSRARGLRRRRGDGRPRCLRRALDAGPHRRHLDERARSGLARRSTSRARSPGGTWRPCWPSTARGMACAPRASTSAGIWRAAAGRHTRLRPGAGGCARRRMRGEVLGGLASFYDEAQEKAA